MANLAREASEAIRDLKANGELKFNWRQWRHPGMDGMPGIKSDRGASGLNGMTDYPGNSGRQKRSWRKRTTRTLSAKSGPSGPAGDISIPRYPVRLGLIYLFTFFISIFLFADDFHRCDDIDVSPFRLLLRLFPSTDGAAQDSVPAKYRDGCKSCLRFSSFLPRRLVGFMCNA